LPPFRVAAFESAQTVACFASCFAFRKVALAPKGPIGNQTIVCSLAAVVCLENFLNRPAATGFGELRKPLQEQRLCERIPLCCVVGSIAGGLIRERTLSQRHFFQESRQQRDRGLLEPPRRTRQKLPFRSLSVNRQNRHLGEAVFQQTGRNRHGVQSGIPFTRQTCS